MEEQWKRIEDFPNYYISNLGKVRSHKTSNTKIIDGWVSNAGYNRVTLRRHDKRYRRAVHRLVAEAFIPNPKNKSQVNHIDGDKLNNHVNNLEWVTSYENVKHSIKNNLNNPQKGEGHPFSKLKEEDVMRINERYDNGESSSEIAKDYPVNYRSVMDIVNGKTWAHVTGNGDNNDILKEIAYAINNCKTDSGAVILGDKLERKIINKLS